MGGKEEHDILKINIRGEAHTEAKVLGWVGAGAPKTNLWN